MAGKWQGGAVQRCQGWVLRQAAVLAVLAARGVLSSGEAPWSEAVSHGPCPPVGTLCQELEPGDAEPRGTLRGGARTATEGPTVSSGNTTE